MTVTRGVSAPLRVSRKHEAWLLVPQFRDAQVDIARPLLPVQNAVGVPPCKLIRSQNRSALALFSASACRSVMSLVVGHPSVQILAAIRPWRCSAATASTVFAGHDTQYCGSFGYRSLRRCVDDFIDLRGGRTHGRSWIELGGHAVHLSIEVLQDEFSVRFDGPLPVDHRASSSTQTF